MADQKDLQKRHQEDQREIKRLQQELRRQDKALAEAAALLIASKKDSGLLGRGRKRLTSPNDRRKAVEILDEGMANGARARELALLLGMGLTRCSAAAVSLLVTVMASSVARAAACTWLTASVRRNTNGFC